MSSNLPSAVEARSRTLNTRKPRVETPACREPARKRSRPASPAQLVQAPIGPPTGTPDPVLAGVFVGLVSFGVMMVYSASAVFAYSRYENGQHFLSRQAVHAVAGLVLMFALSRLDYHRLRRLSWPMLGASVLLLGLTSSGLAHSANGAARWIEVAGVHIQPAEIAKLTMLLWLSYSLSKKAASIRSFSIGFLPHLLVAGLLAALCLRQPDFGSAVMICLLTLVLLFTAGARIGYIIATGLLAIPVVWHLVADSDYRLRRITAFLSPWEHRLGASYQVTESLMSFGAGGVTGVGIGDGRQKLLYLPEAHTDFISAIVGEELGFIGFALMVGAYLLLLYRGLRAAYRSADDYGTYLAVGITLFIALQAFINLGVALSLLPTKGLVLPFISYGGNALLVNCAAAGVLLSVSRPRAVPAESTQDDGGTRSNSRVVQAGGMA